MHHNPFYLTPANPIALNPTRYAIAEYAILLRTQRCTGFAWFVALHSLCRLHRLMSFSIRFRPFMLILFFTTCTSALCVAIYEYAPAPLFHLIFCSRALALQILHYSHRRYQVLTPKHSHIHTINVKNFPIFQAQRSFQSHPQRQTIHH